MIFTNLITTNLRTKTFGKEIAYYQRLESTNLESWELIDEKSASHGMIVITDNQTNGKGRRGNNWFMSPSKGLAMSIVLIKPMKIEDAELIPLVAGVAMVKALQNRGMNPKLKWPNDIFIEDKKCGGILCESRVSNNLINAMVVGIGLNVNETDNDFPKEIRPDASSIFINTGNTIQRELVCAIFTTYFERVLHDLKSVVTSWSDYCFHLNREVSFSHKKTKYSGIFKGLNEKGHAILDINGKIETFGSINFNTS